MLPGLSTMLRMATVKWPSSAYLTASSNVSEPIRQSCILFCIYSICVSTSHLALLKANQHTMHLCLRGYRCHSSLECISSTSCEDRLLHLVLSGSMMLASFAGLCKILLSPLHGLYFKLQEPDLVVFWGSVRHELILVLSLLSRDLFHSFCMKA